MGWFFDTNTGYTRSDIPEGEVVLGTFTAAILKFGMSASGAEMVVTTNYVILNPINTEAARVILKELAQKLGVPIVGEAIGRLEQTGITEPILIPRQTIQAVGPIDDGGFFSRLAKPPGIRFTFTTGGTFDIGILRSVTTPNFHPANKQQRDIALSLLRS